jgi:Rieske 2Fe-2S family protein
MIPTYANDRPPTDASVKTLPARYYTDPAWFQRELERIHFDMWLYAGRSERIPAPGDYFLLDVGHANLLVLRDERGEVRAFHNVCRHRGTYRLDGRLAQAPHMEKVEGFEPADYPLGAVAVATWAGHLFVNLAARPVPFAEHLAGLDARFAAWAMDEMRVVERRRYELRANWKLVIQNYHECLHCPTAHPQLQRLSHYLSGDNEPPQPTYLGARMDLREGVATLSNSDLPRRPPLPGLSEEQRRSVYYYALLPNLLLNLHPDYVVTFRLDPRAVDRTDILCEWLFPSAELARPGFDPSDAIEFWHETNLQDWELSDLAQAGIGSRGYRPGPYSNREELLVALDRWVLDRVGEAR